MFRKYHFFEKLLLFIVGNPQVILIDSLFHHPWVHLVTFACFQSNMHDLCDLFLPNEIKCYVCVLLFCFGGALFKPNGGINKCCCGMLWRSVLFYSYYILDDWDSSNKCIYGLIWVSVKCFWWFPPVRGLTFPL